MGGQNGNAATLDSVLENGRLLLMLKPPSKFLYKTLEVISLELGRNMFFFLNDAK